MATVADQEVIRDLLVALGAKVDPQTNKQIGDFDQRLKGLKARMVDLASYVPKFAAALSGMFSPQLIADAKELNRLLAAQPAAIAQVAKAATESSKATQEARDARRVAREAAKAQREAARAAAKASREEAAAARLAAKAEKDVAREAQRHADAVAAAAAKVKEQAQELAQWALFGAKAVAGMFAAGIGAATAAAVTTGQHAEQIERQARALNLTRKEYQEYAHVFETFGSDQAEISEAFLQITEKVTDLTAGSKTVAEEFALIGLSAKDLKGKRPGEIFEIVSDAIAKTTDKQAALGAASKLFGEDTAKKLLPAMVQGAAGIRALREEAHDLGVVMEDDALASGAALAKQWRTLKSTTTGLKNEIGTALAPVINRLLGGLLEWVKANRELLSQRVEWFARNLERALVQLDKTVQRFGGWDVVFVNVATGAGMLGFLANLDKAEKLLGALRMGLKAIQSTGGAALSSVGLAGAPVLLLLAAVVLQAGLIYLVFDDLYTYFTGGKSVFDAMLDGLAEAVPAFGAWRELVQSIMAYMRALGGIVWAVATGATDGMAPGLQAISDKLQPLRDLLRSVKEETKEWFEWWRNLAATPLSNLAKRINVAAYDLGAQAPSVQAAAQDAVAGQVGGMMGTQAGSSTVDNSHRSVTATNHFYGSNVYDQAREAAAQRRQAALVVTGTEQ
jgi:hypothetical protein